MAARKLALFDTEKAKDRALETAVNPLVIDGKKIVPSVTRVFNTSRPLYVFLQAYRPTGSIANNQPLFAFVSLYQGNTKAYESQPIAVVPQSGSRLGLTPLNFNIDIHALTPGEYQCQVAVLDPSTSKVTFWRASIMMVSD
jgi:hypothetical protein